MQKYNFYEFSGFQLIEKLQQNGNEPVDFSTRTNKILTGVIKSVEARNDNAMFYQTKKCLLEMAGTNENDILESSVFEWNDNSLKNVLIYIDFSGVFPFEKYAAKKFLWKKGTPDEQKKENIKTCARIVEKFFAEGFDIVFDEKKEPVHYVPFEKAQVWPVQPL